MMADLIGKSMIQRTFERVRSSAAVAQVFLTTESEELASHARTFTPNVIISSESPKNGMYEPPFYIFSASALITFCRERLGEIERLLPSKCKFILNIHGDEPFLNPAHLETVINVLLSIPSNHTRIIGASLRTRLTTEQDATSRAKVKMIINPHDETVLYLSRALIPHSKSGEYNPQAVYWSHINIMCCSTPRPVCMLVTLSFCRAFRRGYPTVYASTPTQPAQGEEDVEYNKILESGFTFKTAEVEECERDVNTAADLEFLRQKYSGIHGEL
jgi:3-deoxy-manno-octulosonate cytidylyltransferase (CMP-KDO synthetase)